MGTRVPRRHRWLAIGGLSLAAFLIYAYVHGEKWREEVGITVGGRSQAADPAERRSAVNDVLSRHRIDFLHGVFQDGSFAPLLGDPDPVIRKDAATQLAVLAPECLESVVDAADGLDPERRKLALTAFVDAVLPPGAGEPPPWLGRALVIAGAHRQLRIFEILAARGADQLAPVIQLLGDPSPVIRSDAARALGVAGSNARDAADALAARLDDPEAEVRRAAIEALGHIPASTESLAGRLALRLDDADPGVVEAAARQLGRLGPSGNEVLASAIERLPNDRVAALLPALGTLDASRATLVPPLAARLDSADPVAAQRIARALAEVAEPAIPALGVALASTRAATRYWALESLRMMGEAGAPAVALVARGLTDPDVAVRIAALGALRSSGAAAEERDGIERAALDPDAGVQMRARKVLDSLKAS